MNDIAGQTASPLEASDLQYLEPKDLRFVQGGVSLHLTVEENISYLGVKIFRLFPLCEPQRYLRVQNNDSEEIGVIQDLTQLSTNNQRLVLEDLERRYLMPVVKRVVHAKERFGTLELEVETSRGFRTFTMRNLRENIVQLSLNRYLLSDVDGNRCDVRNLEELDTISRVYLWRYL